MPKHIFEHPKHKGLMVEQLHYGGQDIRYRVVRSTCGKPYIRNKVMTAETFFERYGSTLGAVFLPQHIAETM
jgi:hypothetical protein